MKMKKLTILLIISLVFSTALHAQSATSEQTNFIKRQYNSFRDDVKLIHKCYLKKTPACSENERAEAKKAAVRVTKKGAALIAAIIGTAVVGVGVYVMRKYQMVHDTFDPKKQAPISEEKAQNMANVVIEGLSDVSLPPAAVYTENTKKAVLAFVKALIVQKNQGETTLYHNVMAEALELSGNLSENETRAFYSYAFSGLLCCYE